MCCLLFRRQLESGFLPQLTFHAAVPLHHDLRAHLAVVGDGAAGWGQRGAREGDVKRRIDTRAVLMKGHVAFDAVSYTHLTLPTIYSV